MSAKLEASAAEKVEVSSLVSLPQLALMQLMRSGSESAVHGLVADLMQSAYEEVSLRLRSWSSLREANSPGREKQHREIERVYSE